MIGLLFLKVQPLVSYTFNSMPLTRHSNVKYLSTIIDDKLSFSNNISQVVIYFCLLNFGIHHQKFSAFRWHYCYKMRLLYLLERNWSSVGLFGTVLSNLFWINWKCSKKDVFFKIHRIVLTDSIHPGLSSKFFVAKI